MPRWAGASAPESVLATRWAVALLAAGLMLACERTGQPPDPATPAGTPAPEASGQAVRGPEPGIGTETETGTETGTGTGTEMGAETGTGASLPAGPNDVRLCGAVVRPEQQRGVCYAHNWQDRGRRGYGSTVSEATLDELAALGIDWISLMPFGFQEGLHSTEVRVVRQWAASETDERIRQTVRQAHERGLRVMLKPHIWISYNEWRGHISHASEEEWARWFDSYEGVILHFAALAEEAGADMLAIGVELDSTVLQDPARWRQIAAAVREVYHGPLVYAANWDTAERVAIWDAVDYVGVQMFAPLADHPNPTPEELRTAAREWLARYEAVSERAGRPLLLTEVGYKSVDGAAVAPWTWPEHLPQHGTVVDEADQAEAYCAILEVFGASEAVAGMYWWKWFTDPSTDEEGPAGFSPRGKLAQEVLREVYGRLPPDR